MSISRIFGALCLLTLGCWTKQLSAQYADQGNGALKHYIWWLDWAGATIANGGSKSFGLPGGITVNVAISNVSTYAPTPAPMNTYFAASPLSRLYDFTNAGIRPSLADAGTGFSSWRFTITATRNGSPIDITVVAADAEASWGRSGAGQTELNHFTSSGSPWQTVSFEKIGGTAVAPTSTVEGCGTNAAIITNTYDGTLNGQSPIIASSSSGALVLDTELDHTTGAGIMAAAFGIMLPYAQGGTLPPSFGEAWHLQKYTAPTPCQDPATANELSPDQSLKLGVKPGDPDNPPGAQDGIALSDFPPYDGSGTYSVTVKLANTTGSDAYLAGYFDYNRDGLFGSGEANAMMIVHNGDGTATVTWTGLPPVLPSGPLSSYAFRFRLCTDKAYIVTASGYAPNGEVEDYVVPTATLCGPLSAAVTPDFSICKGKSATLQASGGKYYSWSPSSGLSDAAIANPVVTINADASYTVTVSNPQGCSLNASVNITAITPVTMTASAAKPEICLHDTVTLSGVGADHYAWTDQDGNSLGSTPSIRVFPDATTSYSVLLTDDACQLQQTQTLTVTVKPLPDVSMAKSNDINCVLSETTLHSRGALDWVWKNSDNDVSDPSSPDPVVRPAQTKYYYVKGTGSNGCSITDSIQVVVDYTDLSTYPVPTAFSPNGDGNNDCFRLKYWGVFKTLEMEVYNRFGQRVFYTAHAGDCWDGTLKGVPQPAGTYIYQIKATTQCGVAYRKGTVILVR